MTDTNEIKCDFCYSDQVEWAIPVKDFVRQTKYFDFGSKGGWAACKECMRDYRDDKLDLILIRVTVRDPIYELIPELEQDLKGLWKQVKENQNGEPYKVEEDG